MSHPIPPYFSRELADDARRAVLRADLSKPDGYSARCGEYGDAEGEGDGEHEVDVEGGFHLRRRKWRVRNGRRWENMASVTPGRTWESVTNRRGWQI